MFNIDSYLIKFGFYCLKLPAVNRAFASRVTYRLFVIETLSGSIISIFPKRQKAKRYNVA